MLIAIYSHPLLSTTSSFQLYLQIITMEFTKKVTGGSSSSSSPFVDLFGPKDSSMPSSSAGHFSSVFGPSSTVSFPCFRLAFSEILTCWFSNN